MRTSDISAIMGYIDEGKLEELGKFYRVDKANHKITAAFILKSFVRSALLGRPISLRAIEEMTSHSCDLSSMLKISDRNLAKIDHSSVGKRLEKAEVKYYQALYEDLVLKYNKAFAKSDQKKFYRFDSTIINLSGKIIKDGLRVGGRDKDNQIKITIGLKNQIPASARFCSDRSEASEDIALPKAINEVKLDKEDILLFDRGISKSLTYLELTANQTKFVTRIKTSRHYLPVKQNQITTNSVDKENGLIIESDEIINLYNSKSKPVKCDLRLIKAINSQGNQLWFLTNLLDSTATEITEFYKRRWDIEVFFKFIKQHLQFKHFISHNANGMQIYIYCILIAAILFTIFKTLNKLQGFKIPLLRFTLLLEKEIIKDLVILSGGDWEKVEHRL